MSTTGTIHGTLKETCRQCREEELVIELCGETADALCDKVNEDREEEGWKHGLCPACLLDQREHEESDANYRMERDEP